MTLQVTMEQVLMATSSSKPTSCQLTLLWTGKGRPERVAQKVLLDGSKGSRWFRIEYSPQTTASKFNTDKQNCYSDVRVSESHYYVLGKLSIMARKLLDDCNYYCSNPVLNFCRISCNISTSKDMYSITHGLLFSTFLRFPFAR